MQGPEKNSYKEFGNEKKFLQVENSPPPHNFSNGPSLKSCYIDGGPRTRISALVRKRTLTEV